MIPVLLEILNPLQQARQVLLPSNAREDSAAAREIVLVKTKFLIIYIEYHTSSLISFVPMRASFLRN